MIHYIWLLATLITFTLAQPRSQAPVDGASIEAMPPDILTHSHESNDEVPTIPESSPSSSGAGPMPCQDRGCELGYSLRLDLRPPPAAK